MDFTSADLANTHIDLSGANCSFNQKTGPERSIFLEHGFTQAPPCRRTLRFGKTKYILCRFLLNVCVNVSMSYLMLGCSFLKKNCLYCSFLPSMVAKREKACLQGYQFQAGAKAFPQGRQCDRDSNAPCSGIVARASHCAQLDPGHHSNHC